MLRFFVIGMCTIGLFGLSSTMWADELDHELDHELDNEESIANSNSGMTGTMVIRINEETGRVEYLNLDDENEVLKGDEESVIDLATDFQLADEQVANELDADGGTSSFFLPFRGRYSHRDRYRHRYVFPNRFAGYRYGGNYGGFYNGSYFYGNRYYRPYYSFYMGGYNYNYYNPFFSFGFGFGY